MLWLTQLKAFSMSQKIPLALDLLFRAIRILFNKEYMANFFENHIDSDLG
jgi:hypothetical protein